MAETRPAPRSDAEHEALVRAARGGEGGALDRWLEVEHRCVWKLCLALCADASEADDLAQDAMMHLSEKLDLWDEARPWSAWRRRIVLNLCRDRMRRSDARRRAESGSIEARLPRQLPSPVEQAQSVEVREALAASLAILPPREREVFVLRDLEAVPTAEVGRMLEIGASRVRSLLTLARRRLREHLSARLPGLVPGGEEPAL
jgi:RNA polymerase sigma-70 factor (ECF subfamily)